ncbi:MAG: ribbon-helix-helix protein, CopG family [Chloroflexi bacterium]|nr:ribbon-helix-helix protein, CopG family [Chloroflexota bacterium]
MGRAVKIGISLPSELLETAERRRQASGQSRSEFFRYVLEAFLRREQEQEDIDQYVQAYRRYPETPEEIRAADQNAAEVLAGEPWE